MPPEGARSWEELKEALGEVLLAGGDERARRLDELAGGDEALRGELDTWLALEADARGFLEAPAPGATWERPALPTLGPGARVGGYRIQGILGLGGTSVVYAAEQDQPRRRVALKVFLAGSDSPGALQRFANEAQLLATLRHPGVAQVFEAGTCAEGDGLLPWYAMELVERARPLTVHAREAGLDRRARLELLRAVCDAVAHGHQRGVIHRDLKPANVLVDGEGRPRVIDFGVAKLLGQPRAGSEATLPGSFLGTLAYMSPEQAAGDALAVDTRSDVYALGVLAYEVLCGALPYDLTERSLAEALETIRRAAPRRPREHGLGADLEAVLLRALEKSPERRYASAAELSDELGRVLAGEPVAARAPSFGYHARLFVRRHRLAVGAALGAVVLVVATVVGTSLHTARVEARERAKAEDVKEFLLSVLELTGPGVSGRHDLPVRVLLDRAAARIDGELAATPSAALEVHATVGKAYRELGLYVEAERHLRRAVELGRATGGARSFEEAVTLSALSDVLLESGQADAAERVLREARAILAGLPDLPPFMVAIVTKKLAEALRQQGRREEAEDLARAALETYEAAFGPVHEAVARTRETLGRTLLDDGRAAEALEQGRRSLAQDESAHGAQSLEAARVRALVADALDALGRADEARVERARALADLSHLLPDDHPLLATVRARAAER